MMRMLRHLASTELGLNSFRVQFATGAIVNRSKKVKMALEIETGL